MMRYHKAHVQLSGQNLAGVLEATPASLLGTPGDRHPYLLPSGDSHLLTQSSLAAFA